MKSVAALSAVFLAALPAMAGPFGLFGRKAQPAAQPAQGQVIENSGELYSAQGVANRIARTGVFRHWGNPTGGYEGIGMGGTPAAAEANCCYRSRWNPRDVGYARMASGGWVACCRY